jgi:multidrug efflux pump subunit AcrA (membrane-fusion protein)
VDTVNAFVIANGDQMKVTVNVDELDIGSMEVGLQAQITLDAVENETFTGEITSVSGSASASNGVAQYPVEITFDKTEEMLSGMNASVEVIVEQAENVITVPLAAVTDEGDKSYVYTGYDESSGELTGQTEVTLGISDENNVEIQSGLSEGDTIYYQAMGSEDSSSTEGMDGFDMNGMGGMDGMGGMNGGDMPSDMKQNGKGGGDRTGGGGPGGQQ